MSKSNYSSQPSVAGDSASAIVAEAVSGSHVLAIKGYSHTKGIGKGNFLNSRTFAIGGHQWYIRYYPDGYGQEHAGWISFFLSLDYAHAGNASGVVRADFKFSLLGQDGKKPVGSSYDAECTESRTFSPSTKNLWGFSKFIRSKDLEKSVYLRDDTFSVRCDVNVKKDVFTEPVLPSSILVPPSDLHRHIGRLLTSGEWADVTFEVGGETFAAHRYILAARSSVFAAELFGPMKEKAATSIWINDMEAKVFEAMLRFIYTDALPEMEEGEEDVMAQRLLVAADRYDLERLKLICEEKLCKHINTSSVAATLALAEQHGCPGLKEPCFKFLNTAGNTKAVMASNGFKHLKASCLSILEELIRKFAP